jgi:hypothetical protein
MGVSCCELFLQETDEIETENDEIGDRIICTE